MNHIHSLSQVLEDVHPSEPSQRWEDIKKMCRFAVPAGLVRVDCLKIEVTLIRV